MTTEIAREHMTPQMRRGRMKEIDELRFGGNLSAEEERQLGEEWNRLMTQQEEENVLDAYEDLMLNGYFAS